MRTIDLFAAVNLGDLAASGWQISVLFVLGVVILVLGIIIINFFSIWIRALFSGARVTFTDLIALRLRRVPVGLIVDSRITAVKSGLDVTIDDLWVDGCLDGFQHSFAGAFGSQIDGAGPVKIQVDPGFASGD